MRTPASPVALPASSQVLLARPGIYCGITIRETAGSTAVVVLYDNATSAAGIILEEISLVAGESVREYYPNGITAATGIYYSLVSGTVAGSVRIG